MPRIILTIALLSTMLGIGILFARHPVAFRAPRARSTRGGDFTLQGARGPWSLSKDGKGFVMLLYFGFTHCPGLCPMTMSAIRTELGKLPPQKRSLVKVVFVSVDYQRDTSASTDTYAKSFGPEFTGLIGSKAELDSVTAKYGAAYEVKETPPGSGKYSVDHSNQVFVIDPDGELVDWLAVGYEDAKLGKTIQDLVERAFKGL